MKRLVGYLMIVMGYEVIGLAFPHDFLSWKTAWLVGGCFLIFLASSVLDAAKYDLWPWDVNVMGKAR